MLVWNLKALLFIYFDTVKENVLEGSLCDQILLAVFDKLKII